MYKILTLNGGGIRAYLTLRVLAHIEKESGYFVRDMFDLVVGTSAGAFIGAMLHNLPAQYVCETLISSYKDQLFKPNWFSFGGIFNTIYNTESKENLINELVGHNSFKNYDFAALAYDIKSNRPVVFNTIEDDNDSKYLLTTKYSTSQAVIASTAAPLYWDPYTIDYMTLIDGAIVGNDPTDVAIKLALGKSYKLDDLYIVNVTTGTNTRTYNFESGANPLKWTIPFINMLMSSQANATSMLYKKEGLYYHNLDTPLVNSSDSIDDISDENIHALTIDADNLIKAHEEDIHQIIKDLC